MNEFARFVRPSRAALAASALMASAASHAALPEGVSSAITGAGTDAATVGGLIIVALAGLFLFTLIRKVLK